MKTIKIAIKNADIFQELAKMTAYTGAKSDSNALPDVFDRVATVKEDNELLSRYWETACSGLVDRLKSFVTVADYSGDSLSLQLEVSGSYDDSLTPSLRTDIFSYLVADIAARWFGITLPEKAESYGSEASRLLTEAERKLFHRKRPVRRMHNA